MKESVITIDKGDLTREANKTSDSRFDRIYKHFHSKSRIELTKDETDTMIRWEKAWLLLCRHRTRNQVAQVLEKIFGISRATAYDDVRSAMNLFSDPREDMKAAKRAIAEDGYLKGADKAWKQNDLEMHKKYMDKYAELNGLFDNSNDSSLADMLKQFKPVQVIMNFKSDDLLEEAERMRKVFGEFVDYEDVQ